MAAGSVSLKTDDTNGNFMEIIEGTVSQAPIHVNFVVNVVVGQKAYFVHLLPCAPSAQIAYEAEKIFALRICLLRTDKKVLSHDSLFY